MVLIRGQVPLQFILPFGFDWATMWVLDFYFYYYFGSDALSLSDIDVEKTILS